MFLSSFIFFFKCWWLHVRLYSAKQLFFLQFYTDCRCVVFSCALSWQFTGGRGAEAQDSSWGRGPISGHCWHRSYNDSWTWFWRTKIYGRYDGQGHFLNAFWISSLVCFLFECAMLFIYEVCVLLVVNRWNFYAINVACSILRWTVGWDHPIFTPVYRYVVHCAWQGLGLG